MTIKINTPNARSKLEERREPYWHPIRRGCAIGYRVGAGTWLARYYDGQKKHYKALEAVLNYDSKDQFDKALEEAEKWFKTVGKRGRYTIKDAAEDYIASLSRESGERAAKDARTRFKGRIYPTFENTYLDSLTTANLNAWLASFIPADGSEEDKARAKRTAVRYKATFWAALNQAFRNGHISDDSAWRKAGFEKGKGRRKALTKAREVRLTDPQIQRLLDKTEGAFQNLCRGILLTGLRPGIEIEHIQREQHKPNGTLEILESKTGPRTVYLSREAQAFFNALSKGKHPKAYLFARDDGRRWPEKEAQRLMIKARKAAKLPAETVLYSLRHTYISRALESGASLKLIADNCGTSIRMIEQHYWKEINAHRQGMLDRVSVLPS